MDAHDILEISKSVRARHAPTTPGGEAFDQVKSGRVTKTIARNRDRVSGDKTKTSQGNKGSLQPGTILWANEAGWMKPMLGLAPADSSKLMQNSGLLAAAKIVYILKHKFAPDDVSALLVGCGISDPASADYVLAAKSLRENQSKYQCEVICEWEAKAANNDKKFEELTLAELQALW